MPEPAEEPTSVQQGKMGLLYKSICSTITAHSSGLKASKQYQDPSGTNIRIAVPARLFALLPLELHDEIGSFLDLQTSTNLRYSCKAAYVAYERSQLKHAANILWLCIRNYVKENRSRFGTFSIEDIPDNRYEQANIGHLDVERRVWYLTDFQKRLFRTVPTLKLRDLMHMNGSWDQVLEAGVVLMMAIKLCSCDFKGFEGLERMELETVKMVADRLLDFESEGRERMAFHAARMAVSNHRMACLTILYKRGLCPSSEKHKQTSELLFEALTLPVTSTYYETPYILETLEFLLVNLEARPNRPHIIDMPELSSEPIVIRILVPFIEAANRGGSSMHDNDTMMSAKVLNLLIEHDLDLQSTAIEDFIYFDEARSSFVGILANAGLDMMAWRDDQTFMHRFACEPDGEVLEILLEQGADVNSLSRLERHTPLMVIVHSLARAFMGVNLEDMSLGKDLLQATLRNRKATGESYGLQKNIRLLMKHGADPFIVSTTGLTAISIGMLIGDMELITDLTELDCRRLERYGSLKAHEIYEKWRNDDELWTVKLAQKGAYGRRDLEPQE
ncbi:hypothetical protein BJ508DRAFT_363872 [Ascobolus immersus RN42]|uniref:Uncharacterized protein n=1 Tax=Ascobolus immersus RN42 TaxID=1160509 RepID=A0A3N4HXA2_ASCIM|nr:hypothetical protein BJ508DRAFT_363872 [Ascobolus immersus RN42]